MVVIIIETLPGNTRLDLVFVLQFTVRQNLLMLFLDF